MLNLQILKLTSAFFMFSISTIAMANGSNNSVDSVKNHDSVGEQPILSTGISSASEEDALDLNPGSLAEANDKTVSANASYPMYLNSLNLESRFAMPVIRNRLGIGVGANYSPQSSVGGIELGLGGGLSDVIVGGLNVITERTISEMETKFNFGLKIGGNSGLAGAATMKDASTKYREFGLGVSYRTSFGLTGGLDLNYPSFSRTISFQPMATYEFGKLLSVSAGYWMPVKSAMRGSAFASVATRPWDWLALKLGFDARFTEISFSVIGFF